MTFDDLILPAVQRLPPYQPGATEDAIRARYGVSQVTKLSQNESALGPSPAALQALQQGCAWDRYPDPDQLQLRSMVAQSCGATPEEVVFGNGSSELIALLCRAFADGEGHAVIGNPSFSCYGLYLQAAGVPFTAVPLRDALQWQVDDLLAAVMPRTKLLFLDNPNNPTGHCLPADELRRLLQRLPEHVLAVVDEAYAEYVEGEEFVSALQMRGLRHRLLVLRTFSKAYGLAALRVGYAIGPEPCIDALRRLRLPFSLNGLAQAAALAAFADHQHLQRVVQLNQQERHRLTDALRGLGYRVADSQANFLLLHARIPSQEAFEQLARRGVIVRSFGGALPGWLRCTLATPAENDVLLASLQELRHTLADGA